MFESLNLLPADPILGLLAAFREDGNPKKVDLGVGVYKDEVGHTSIMQAVKKAEFLRLEQEDSKSYIGPAGAPGFNSAIQQLMLGAGHKVLLENRIRTSATPGGCGALRVAAELIKKSNPSATIWVSNPTWANHIPLLGSAGLQIKEYPYYDANSKSVDFDAMMECLAKVGQGDVVLLHGCCHNPCGADLDQQQWQQVVALAQKNGFTPFIDIAYQGFGEGLEADAYGLRLMAESVPEMIIAQSCSKNFGLYRERAGSISIIAADPAKADATFSNALSLVRGNYSMPPAHGPAIVEIILNNAELNQEWQTELNQMCQRMNNLRNLLVDKLAEYGASQGFDHIRQQKGMFSFLGINQQQVQRLIKERSVYMVDSSRINIAGISKANVDYLAESICSVLD